MISKPVPANSFYHTCRYICNKQGAEVLLIEGVRGHDYKLMADDFKSQQQLRPSKSQACFHSILSFYPGEKPSDEVMKEIAIRYLKDLGIMDTQYAISKHTDKAHLHLHIVANMVNNEGKAISDSWVGLRGKKVAQRLTQEHNLIPALEKNLTLTNLEALSQFEANKYSIYIAISESLPHCHTMEELEKRLLKQGIETQYKFKGQTLEKQGISFRRGNICFKGSQVHRKFSLASLEKTLELQRKQVSEQEQKPNLRGFLPMQKVATRQVPQADVSAGIGKDISQSRTKELEKAIEIMLKPEHTIEHMPYELSPEAKRRRKKKQSQRHSR